ncbi:MAG: S8 family serine peptidase, partial [Shewanella sp.]
MEKYIVLREVTPSSPNLKRGISSEVHFANRQQTQLKIEIENVPDKALVELHRDPQVKSAAPAITTKLIKPFNTLPITEGDAWGIAAVGADVSPYTGEGVTVAVLDTGIDISHPAFRGVNIYVEDFTGTGKQDGNGHGTHCAGTIFGRDIGGQRIGIARGVKKALIGKVLGDDGAGSSEMIFQALQWAQKERANVISMSLGFDFPGTVKRKVDAGWPVDLATSQALEAYRGNLRMFDSIMSMFKAQAAFNCSPVVVAAAGNESRREINGQYKIAASVPAAADGVLSVAAAQRLGD